MIKKIIKAIYYFMRNPEMLYCVAVISIFAGIFNYNHSDEPLVNFKWWFVVGIVSGIIAFIVSVRKYSLMEKTKEKMLHLWSNFKFGGICAFIVGFIMEIIFFVQGHKEYGEGQFSEIDLNNELYVLLGLVIVGGVVVFLIGYFNYKNTEKKSMSSFY